MNESEDLNQWQIDETKKALEEADRGDFATDNEVQQTFKKRTPTEF